MTRICCRRGQSKVRELPLLFWEHTNGCCLLASSPKQELPRCYSCRRASLPARNTTPPTSVRWLRRRSPATLPGGGLPGRRILTCIMSHHQDFGGQHMRTTATSSQFSQPKNMQGRPRRHGHQPTIAARHRRRAAVGLPSRSKRHASLRRSGAERGGLHCGLRLRRVPVPRRGGRVPASESASSSPSAGGIRMKLAHAIFPQRAQAWLHRGDRRRPHQQQLSTNALTGVVAVYAGSGPEPRRSP